MEFFLIYGDMLLELNTIEAENIELNEIIYLLLFTFIYYLHKYQTVLSCYVIFYLIVVRLDVYLNTCNITRP